MKLSHLSRSTLLSLEVLVAALGLGAVVALTSACFAPTHDAPGCDAVPSLATSAPGLCRGDARFTADLSKDEPDLVLTYDDPRHDDSARLFAAFAPRCGA